MEALTWLRAYAADDEAHVGLVHLMPDDGLTPERAECGVRVEAVEAPPKVSPSCPVCRVFVEVVPASVSFADAAALVAEDLASQGSPLLVCGEGWSLPGAYVVTALHPDREVIPGATHRLVSKDGRLLGSLAPLEVGLGRLDRYPRVRAKR